MKFKNSFLIGFIFLIFTLFMAIKSENLSEINNSKEYSLIEAKSKENESFEGKTNEENSNRNSIETRPPIYEVPLITRHDFVSL